MQNLNMPPLTPASDSESTKQNGRWTKEEHQKFMEGVRLYGKNWKKIQEVVRTRNGSQIRSHAQKFFNKHITEDTGSVRKMSETEENHSITNSKQSHLNIDFNPLNLNLNFGLTHPPFTFSPEDYENIFIPPLDPYTLLPKQLTEVDLSQSKSKSERAKMPHQIWKQSNEVLLKTKFIATFVDYQEPEKENKEKMERMYQRKSSFTRCE